MILKYDKWRSINESETVSTDAVYLTYHWGSVVGQTRNRERALAEVFKKMPSFSYKVLGSKPNEYAATSYSISISLTKDEDDFDFMTDIGAFSEKTADDVCISDSLDVKMIRSFNKKDEIYIIEDDDKNEEVVLELKGSAVNLDKNAALYLAYPEEEIRRKLLSFNRSFSFNIKDQAAREELAERKMGDLSWLQTKILEALNSTDTDRMTMITIGSYLSFEATVVAFYQDLYSCQTTEDRVSLPQVEESNQEELNKLEETFSDFDRLDKSEQRAAVSDLANFMSKLGSRIRMKNRVDSKINYSYLSKTFKMMDKLGLSDLDLKSYVSPSSDA